MSENIKNESQIHNFIKTIRALARTGSANFDAYFSTPLADWTTDVNRVKPDYFGRVIDGLQPDERPLMFHRAIAGAVYEANRPQAGTIAIRFLRDMLMHEIIRNSQEAEEFFSHLDEPFLLFSRKENRRLESKFEKRMDSLDPGMVKNLLQKTLQTDMSKNDQAPVIASRERTLLRQMADEKNLKNGIVSYLIRFAIPSMVKEGNHALYLFDDLGIDNDAIRRDLLNTSAVMLYHDLLSAIRDNDMIKAVRNISRFAILFRGDPETPYYQQMDSFEKKFMELVEERNIWDELS